MGDNILDTERPKSEDLTGCQTSGNRSDDDITSSTDEVIKILEDFDLELDGFDSCSFSSSSSEELSFELKESLTILVELENSPTKVVNYLIFIGERAEESSSFISDFVLFGGVRLLVNQLESKSEEIQCQSLTLLHTLVVGKKARLIKREIMKANGIEIAFSFLQSPASQVQKMGIKLMHSLTEDEHPRYADVRGKIQFLCLEPLSREFIVPLLNNCIKNNQVPDDNFSIEVLDLFRILSAFTGKISRQKMRCKHLVYCLYTVIHIALETMKLDSKFIEKCIHSLKNLVQRGHQANEEMKNTPAYYKKSAFYLESFFNIKPNYYTRWIGSDSVDSESSQQKSLKVLGADLLWHPVSTRLFCHLLVNVNPQNKELISSILHATGNLVLGHTKSAKLARRLLVDEFFLDGITQFLQDEHDSVVYATVLVLFNLATEADIKETIARSSMQSLLDLVFKAKQKSELSEKTVKAVMELMFKILESCPNSILLFKLFGGITDMTALIDDLRMKEEKDSTTFKQATNIMHVIWKCRKTRKFIEKEKYWSNKPTRSFHCLGRGLF